MATYKEVFDAALMKAGMVVPVSWLTPSLGLLWISEYIHDAQAQLGIKKCSTTITLSATSTDGKYKLPCSIDAVDEITLSPTGVTPPQYMPVVRMPLDAFHRLIQDWPDFRSQIDANTWFWQDPWVDTNLLYCTILPGQIQFFPYATPGIVTIHYKGLLPVYSKSSPDWAAFGPDPAAAMEVTNIPIEFETAVTAITAYVARQIVGSQPKGYANYGPQVTAWLAQEREGIKILRRRNVDYVQDTKQPTALGPVF